jgi:hypothetical protein
MLPENDGLWLALRSRTLFTKSSRFVEAVVDVESVRGRRDVLVGFLLRNERCLAEVRVMREYTK